MDVAGGLLCGAEVADAGDRVADEDVVGADAVTLEAGAECDHGVGVVVDAAEEDALIGDRDAMLNEKVAGGNGFRGEFARMVELGLDPEALTGGKALDKGCGPAHGEDDRGARAEADGIELRKGRQRLNPCADSVVAEEHRVATGEEDFAYGGSRYNGRNEVFEAGTAGIIKEALAGAVAAIGGAGGVDHRQDAVGEALFNAGRNSGGGAFTEGVRGVAVVDGLARVGKELAQDGVVRVIPVG